MKILIITQVVDTEHPILGFFHNWIAEFAKNFEKVTVVCLFKGKYDLPDNVKVVSLGKEEGGNKFKYTYRFFKYLFKYRREYDQVFVHMNQIYVILGGLYWRLMGKKVNLWYAHGTVTNSLRIATLLSHKIFTSTDNGFRIDTKKKNVVGQGIDTDIFSYGDFDSREDKFLVVGRISPVKGFGVILDAVKEIDQEVEIEVVGEPSSEEEDKYMNELKSTGIFNFLGKIPNHLLNEKLREAKVLINMSDNGSLDKTMVEAMSSGLIVISCNEAYGEVVGDDNELYCKKDPSILASLMLKYLNINKEDYEKISKDLREEVINHHSLDKFVKKITKIMYE